VLVNIYDLDGIQCLFISRMVLIIGTTAGARNQP